MGVANSIYSYATRGQLASRRRPARMDHRKPGRRGLHPVVAGPARDLHPGARHGRLRPGPRAARLLRFSARSDQRHGEQVYADNPGPATRELIDPAWLVPSDKLAEVCTPTGAGRHRGPRWLFTADRSGLARDRAAKYQVAVRELAAARRWSILPARSAVAGVSANPVEIGTFFERHFDAAFLEAASGDEVLMAAAPDNFGRHRLAFSKETGRWASIAIHGSAVSNATNLIQANIHATTFFPHPRHYVLVQHYDRRRAEWYEWSWFMRSTDFAKLAVGTGPYLLFTTTLNPQRVNRWTRYRIPTTTAAAAFQSALHRSTSRRAA